MIDKTFGRVYSISMSLFKQYLTPEQAGKICGVGSDRILQFIAGKRFPATFEHGRWWIPKGPLRKFAKKTRPAGRPKSRKS